ncbi:T-complex protein 1 subunit gamma, partial [Chelonia mydas]
VGQNTKRESGRKVQIGNISAAKTIADIIRTCLGPRAMMKMLLDPMGGIVMTNDGNAILREIQVQHPAAKSMIEISRTQDEEVGDGTTSVIILAGEMLAVAEHFLEQQMHPTVIIGAYRKALDDMISTLNKISTPVDVNNREMMLNIIKSAINTKAISHWSDLACGIALDAVKTVEFEENGRKEIDIKNYAKVEKIPGGIIEDSCVLRGIMVNKDVTHPRMRRYIKNPRILLLDCSLEYKKGESQTDIEITREEDFARILQMEEEYIQQICEDLIRVKPDLIITEKGISDLAQHYLMRANITAIRRVRKTDNNRIARACGARIVSRTDELRDEDVGTGARLFEVKKIGDEYFTFITDCKDPKACTVMLRGASKEILAEVERNLQDAMQVCRNVLVDPQLVPGGGAAEMAVSHALTEKSKVLTGVEQWPYRAVAQALEVIPRTLIQNCGASTIRVLTSLRAKHTQEGSQTWGVNGETGALVDMKDLGIWEPLAVKLQTYKTAVETAVLLLRIDDIVSGHKKKGDDQNRSPGAPDAAQDYGVSAVEILTERRHGSKVTLQYIPGSNSSSASLLHVRAVGRNDTLHYVWSGIGAPTVLLVYTRSESSALHVNWTKLLSASPAGAIWIEPPGSVVYSTAVVFTKVFEYNGTNASGLSKGQEEPFYPTYDLAGFSWQIVNQTALMAKFQGMNTVDPGGTSHNGTISFQVTAYEEGGRDSPLPRLLHTANSSKVEFIMDNVAPRGNKSRFLLEVVTVEEKGGHKRLQTVRSIDDEYTPTIFEDLQPGTSIRSLTALTETLGQGRCWVAIVWVPKASGVREDHR